MEKMRMSPAQTISNLYDAVIGDYVLAGCLFENSPTRVVIDRKIEQNVEVHFREFPIDSPMYLDASADRWSPKTSDNLMHDTAASSSQMNHDKETSTADRCSPITSDDE